MGVLERSASDADRVDGRNDLPRERTMFTLSAWLLMLLAATDRRWVATREAAERMEADHMRVLPVRVPRAVRVGSAPRYRAPTGVLEPGSMISYAYRKLAHLLLEELDL
jgi:hypothetical protein